MSKVLLSLMFCLALVGAPSMRAEAAQPPRLVGLITATGDIVPAPRDACVPFPFRDEAGRRPDFVAFRERLLAAIDRRDVDAVVNVAVPDIRLSFGTSQGRDDLRRGLTAAPERWNALRTVLTLGGTWESSNVFTAPYVFSAWPDDHDSFEEQAIVGAHVRVRAAPRADAAVVTSLTSCIVRVAETREPNEDWTAVELGAQAVGYVSSPYIRSPIDYRARFVFKGGRWQMDYFVAGD